MQSITIKNTILFEGISLTSTFSTFECTTITDMATDNNIVKGFRVRYEQFICLDATLNKVLLYAVGKIFEQNKDIKLFGQIDPPPSQYV